MKNTSRSNFKNPSAYIVKMVRTQVGKEQDLLSRLSKESRESIYFKILGKYDILEFSKLKFIHDANVVNTEPYILGMTTFPCFYWERNHRQFWNQILSSPAPCLVFLKLHEDILNKLGILGLGHVMRFLRESKELNTEGTTLYPLSGLGYYEIILWYPADNFETIFSALRKLRSVKVKKAFPGIDEKYAEKGLFIDTTTLPLISYAKVISPENWKILNGKVKPITQVRCSPISELQIGKSFGVKANDVLGSDDLAFYWEEPIFLKSFIPRLLEFRKKWENNCSLIETTTKLLSIEDLPEPSACELSSDKLDKTSYVTEKIRKLVEIGGINRYLINEIVYVVSILNANIAHRTALSLFADVIHSAIVTFSLLIDRYIDCLTQNLFEEKVDIEMDLLEFTANTRAALSQRFPKVEISDAEFGVPSTTTYLVSRVLRAASTVVEFLFGAFTKTDLPNRFVEEIKRQEGLPDEGKNMYPGDYTESWNGFLFFDLTEGYQLHYGEVVSLPLSHIFDPLSWTTLSHEVAHAYYQRISLFRLEDEIIRKVTASITKDRDIPPFMFETNLFAWELFAQWFDYRHFYSGDLDFYLWSIWRTWMNVPRVLENKIEYWVRSVFVRVCSSWDMIREEVGEIEVRFLGNKPRIVAEIKEIFRREYKILTKLLLEFFPNDFEKIKLFSTDDETVMLNILLHFYHFAHYFESFYVNDALLKIMTKKYKLTPKHVNNILEGKIILEHIPNPFVLLRELSRYFYIKKKDPVLSTSSVITLIYSFWNTSSECGMEASK